eukprot:1709955-Pyramimonas_sp.AAC.1
METKLPSGRPPIVHLPVGLFGRPEEKVCMCICSGSCVPHGASGGLRKFLGTPESLRDLRTTLVIAVVVVVRKRAGVRETT